VKLAEASVKDLGEILRRSESQIQVDCPDTSDDICGYKANENTVADYSLRQLLKYPYCEVHGCSLELAVKNQSKEGDTE
jgi:hypothetical protein